LLAEDIAKMRVREFIRAEIWSILQAEGLVAPNRPPPQSPRKKSNAQRLRLVEPEPPDPAA
jgi:hypothetical protein